MQQLKCQHQLRILLQQQLASQLATESSGTTSAVPITTQSSRTTTTASSATTTGAETTTVMATTGAETMTLMPTTEATTVIVMPATTTESSSTGQLGMTAEPMTSYRRFASYHSEWGNNCNNPSVYCDHSTKHDHGGSSHNRKSDNN